MEAAASSRLPRLLSWSQQMTSSYFHSGLRGAEHHYRQSRTTARVALTSCCRAGSRFAPCGECVFAVVCAEDTYRPTILVVEVRIASDHTTSSIEITSCRPAVRYVSLPSASGRHGEETVNSVTSPQWPVSSSGGSTALAGPIEQCQRRPTDQQALSPCA